MAERAEHRCEYCHAPERAFNFGFEVEHIQPAARGGGSQADNLALACRACNAFKAARRTGADPETGSVVPLFHPRTDVWDTHFTVSDDAIAITGRTPTGRATATLLSFNSDAQQEARRLWQRLNLFP